MSRFSSLQLTQEVGSKVLVEEQTQKIPITPSIPTSPQFFMLTDQGGVRTTEPLTYLPGAFPVRTTEQLGNSTNASAVRTTGQLQNVPGLPVTPTPTPNKRIVRIPGDRKLKRATKKTETAAKHTPALSPRLRHSIIFVSILLVVMTTLLYMTPLSSGQGRFTFFQGISNWVHAQQMNWQFQAHLNQVIQNSSTQNNVQQMGPPSMILPKSAYVAIAQQDATNAGISPDYFTRQINQESGFNPNAVSPSGAVGIAQFMPSTARGLGIDPWDPTAALNAAAHLMASYANNYGGDYAKALAAYNGGSGTVQYAISACGAANWMNCLPGETRNYIRVIMGI